MRLSLPQEACMLMPMLINAYIPTYKEGCMFVHAVYATRSLHVYACLLTYLQGHTLLHPLIFLIFVLSHVINLALLCHLIALAANSIAFATDTHSLHLKPTPSVASAVRRHAAEHAAADDDYVEPDPCDPKRVDKVTPHHIESS
jgi:hypothetical protein